MGTYSPCPWYWSYMVFTSLRSLVGLFHVNGLFVLRFFWSTLNLFSLVKISFSGFHIMFPEKVHRSTPRVSRGDPHSSPVIFYSSWSSRTRFYRITTMVELSLAQESIFLVWWLYRSAPESDVMTSDHGGPQRRCHPLYYPLVGNDSLDLHGLCSTST